MDVVFRRAIDRVPVPTATTNIVVFGKGCHFIIYIDIAYGKLQNEIVLVYLYFVGRVAIVSNLLHAELVLEFVSHDTK
jgi:hypothetical protein